MTVHRKAAITGIGSTDFSADSGRTEWELALQAIRPALADAQVEPHEVDGIVRYSYDSVTQPMLVRSLDIPDLRFFCDLPLGGIASGAVVAHAAAAIAAGQASVVLIYRAMNERSGVRYGRAERSVATAGRTEDRPHMTVSGMRNPAGAFSGPYGLLSPGQVMALWTRRYMHEHGLSEADITATLGTVAVQQRRYAQNNENAMMHGRPLDMDGYEQARMISTPLRLYDYCLETDGAAAAVLVSADRARATRDDAAYVLSAGQSMHPHSETLPVYPRDLTRFVPATAIERLYAEAGLTPRDISVAQLYDATSFMVPSALEIYGFAETGRGWRHVLEHGTGPDSPLPVNTHGGHLSEGYIHGMNHILEAVRQIRGASPNQIAGAGNVLFGAQGSSSFILGRR